MENETNGAKSEIPRYRQVAADIAAKIVDRRFQIGEKIYARSLIASQYAVSSETARRAIAILSDMGIVEATRGSGVVIKSYENALFFVKRCRETNTLLELKKTVQRKVEGLAREFADLKEAVVQLVDRTDQFRATDPFAPFEFAVADSSPCVGRSIADLRIWHNTAATVVAIERAGALTVSPGPYEVLRAGDVIYCVGDEQSIDRVRDFIREPSGALLSLDAAVTQP